jgi:hypothetical protein
MPARYRLTAAETDNTAAALFRLFPDFAGMIQFFSQLLSR